MGNILHTLVSHVLRCLRVVPVPFVLHLLPPSWGSLRKHHILNIPLFAVSPILWLAKFGFCSVSVREVSFLSKPGACWVLSLSDHYHVDMLAFIRSIKPKVNILFSRNSDLNSC